MMRGRRQSNIRPVRGITADTVRALLGLRHAGTDCSYLPLERTRLVDQVKGTAPAPCIDLADVPATLRADCDSYPATPVVIGFDLAAKGTDRTVVSIRGRKGHVIIDEYFETPSVAQPAPLGCDDEARSAGPTEPTAPAIPASLDDAERAYDAALEQKPRARRKDDRAGYSRPNSCGRAGKTEGDDAAPPRISRQARPGAAARVAREAPDRDAAEPVLKPQRIDLIRDIAARLEARKTPAPRPIAGPRIERKAVLPMAGDPIAQRREAIERAIRFLKSRCILVTITDRNAMIRKYRVSGKRDTMLAEQVIEHAKAMGLGEQG